MNAILLFGILLCRDGGLALLGGDLEDYFIQVLTAYNGSLTGLFVRPMGWVIWALIILSVVYAVLDNRKAKRQEKELSGKQ